jgi:hypothetical protein
MNGPWLLDPGASAPIHVPARPVPDRARIIGTVHEARIDLIGPPIT